MLKITLHIIFSYPLFSKFQRWRLWLFVFASACQTKTRVSVELATQTSNRSSLRKTFVHRALQTCLTVGLMFCDADYNEYLTLLHEFYFFRRPLRYNLWFPPVVYWLIDVALIGNLFRFLISKLKFISRTSFLKDSISKFLYELNNLKYSLQYVC